MLRGATSPAKFFPRWRGWAGNLSTYRDSDAKRGHYLDRAVRLIAARQYLCAADQHAWINTECPADKPQHHNGADPQTAPADWQTRLLVINPSALAPVALALLAELHGRYGYFVSILNIRPVAGALPLRYEVAEVVALQQLRDAARERRWPAGNQMTT